MRATATIGRTALAALGIGASITPASAATCPAAVPFANGIAVIDAVRVVTKPDGNSAFETVKLSALSKAFFKPGEFFSTIDFGKASKVQLVSGPPNAVLPPHPSLGHEMFLTIQGSSTITLADGSERKLVPGSLAIMDDMGSKTGHGGRTGPCGYVAVEIVPGP